MSVGFAFYEDEFGNVTLDNADVKRVRDALVAIAEKHVTQFSGSVCVECFLPAPCPTKLLAMGDSEE